MMRFSHLIVSVTLLAGCTHDLTELRASAPKQMQEFGAPYDDLSKCAKQRYNNADPTTLILWEDPSVGVTRLVVLTSGGRDAVFEFSFVSQTSQITVIEFRSLVRTDTHSDLVWKAIDECFRHIHELAASDAALRGVPTPEPSIAP
jgi:hypothetical protein